ncbi:MAG: exodeoxyribonuclease VII small subunit [Pseudomonadota bacterium]|nr:exodeoxyribonuclease VII small subunit [Pseudomonadota bacterium]
MGTRRKRIDFDQSLHRLDELVGALEQGDTSLEESLKLFEQGIRLARECQESLRQAEQRVATLTLNDSEQAPAEDPGVEVDP